MKDFFTIHYIHFYEENGETQMQFRTMDMDNKYLDSFRDLMDTPNFRLNEESLLKWKSELLDLNEDAT